MQEKPVQKVARMGNSIPQGRDIFTTNCVKDTGSIFFIDAR
jgi:hypothetical protein